MCQDFLNQYVTEGDRLEKLREEHLDVRSLCPKSTLGIFCMALLCMCVRKPHVVYMLFMLPM